MFVFATSVGTEDVADKLNSAAGVSMSAIRTFTIIGVSSAADWVPIFAMVGTSPTEVTLTVNFRENCN